jgi:hypothetical protein
MGGYGSGRRTDRPSTDECIRMNLAEMKRQRVNRHGILTPVEG